MKKGFIFSSTYDNRAQTIIETVDDYYSPNETIVEEPPPEYYINIRHDISPLVPDDVKSILEVGCAAGITGTELKNKPGVFVAGVEL